MGSVTEEAYTVVDAGKTIVDQKTSYCWTEDQKLAGVLVEDLKTEYNRAHHYLYDHTGNRIMKSNIYSGLVNVNSNSTMSLPMDPPTVYVNSYFIATHYLETVMASKHYYMGGQRIATNLISYAFDHDNPELELIQAPSETDIGYTALSTGAPQDLMATLDCLYGEPQNYTTDFLYLQSIGQEMEFVDCNATVGEPGEGGGGTDPLAEPLCQCEQSTYFAGLNEFNCDELEIIYFYHPDYLGSTEFITDMRGEPYQFFLNTPWGENLENQYAKSYTSFSSRFRFNGKEWDEETGNFYYGARYYDPKVSVWLSVDPLSSEAPGWTPYRFCFNNPVMITDPTGLLESTDVTLNDDGTYTVQCVDVNDGDKGIYVVDENGVRTGEEIGESLTTHSFVTKQGNTVNAVLDPKSTEAKMFKDEIENCTPTLSEYVEDRDVYNIKGEGGTLEDKYRGSQIEEGVYASARDLGNYGAGYVAGKNGMLWFSTKTIFERYHATDNGQNLWNIFGNGTEGVNTVKAENFGWSHGRVDLLKKQ
jgi:RHS repeat-associated protein